MSFRTRNVGVGLLVITTNLLGLIQLANLNSLRAVGALLCVASTYYWWFTSCMSNSDASATVRVLAKSFSALVLADAITEGASWWLEWSANVDWSSAVSLTLVLAPCLCALAGLPFWHAALFTVASVVCRLLVVRSIAATLRSRVLLVPFVGFLSASFAAVLAVSEKNVMEDENVSGVVASAEIDNRKLVEMRPKLQRRRHTASTLPTHAPSSGLDVATIIEAHGLLEEAIAGAPHVLKSRLESIAKLLATQAPAMNLNPNQDLHPLVLTSTLPSDCNGDAADDENDDYDEAASVNSASSVRHRRNRHGTFTTVTDPMGLPQWEAQPTELRSRASTLQFRRGTRANRDSPLADVFWKRSKSDGNDKTKKNERWTPRILSLSANGRERSRSVDYSSSHFNGISERRASSSSPVDSQKLLTSTERVASVLEETVEKENYDDDENDDDDDENDGIFFPAPPLAIGQLLKSIEDWNFEIFKLAELSSDHVLSVLASHVFVKSGLTETFRLPSRKFAAYFQAIESGYHEDNSYHNRIHAADVLHSSYYLITSPVPGFAADSPLSPIDSGVGEGSGSSSTQTDSYEETSFPGSHRPIDEDSSPLFIAFPPLEIMALLIAAAIHDYDHPGRTNAFLVATTHELAVLYNDYSVLENHHVASAWKLLLSSERFNFLQHLEAAELKRLRYLVVELVLSTDLKKHFDILANFSAKCDSLDWSSEQDRLLLLQMIIKMADINTPAKPHPIQVRWTELISREFYAQGDDEKRLGMPVEQFMDRDEPNLARLQVGFIRNLVAPLYNGFARVGLLPGRRERIAPDCAPGDDNAQAIEADSAKSEAKFRFVSPLLENLQENFNIWEERVLEEQIAAEKERFRFIAKTAALKALKRMGLDAVAEDVLSTRINNATE